MKGNKLFLLGAAMMLMITGCKGKGGNTSGGGSSSEEPQPVETKVVPMIIYGQTTGFPKEIIRKFMYSYDLDYDILEVGEEDAEWRYDAYLDYERGNLAAIEITTDDDGEAGVDALEDEVLAYYEEKGYAVDKSRYDDDGYYLQDEEGNDLVLFYTWRSKFHYEIYGPMVELNGVSKATVDYYIQTVLGFDTEFIEIEDGEQWSLYSYVDDSYGPYFSAVCLDNGEPGVDALEDTIQPIFEAAGYTIDDSDYEHAGYYAISADELVRVQFYTYNQRFNVTVFANPAE